MRPTRLIALIALMSPLSTLSSSSCHAADHAAILPYIADETLAVALVDLDQVDIPAAFAELERVVGVVPGLEMTDAKAHGARRQKVVESLRDAGARRLYAVFRLEDGSYAGPVWIVPLDERGDARRVRGLLPSGDPDRDDATVGNHSEVFPNVFREENGVLVGGMSDEHLATVARHETSDQREAFAEALAALGDATAGVVVCPDADSRRVVRELFPACPPPFEAIDGRLLADGVRWTALSATLPPKLSLSLCMQAADEASAKTLEQSATLALNMGKMLALARTASGGADDEQLLAAATTLLGRLTPRIEDARLSIGIDAEGWPEAATVLAPFVARAREAAYRSTRINAFKQIALGLHNYESSKGSFPPQTSSDKEGRPLLSWRVLILPMLQQNDLYKRFRLDEPWDSPHNIELVEKMPDIYADPDPVLRTKVGGGKTTYVVPVGERMAFRGRETTRHRDFKDGTSNTVWLVETPPDRALIWTKPDDWEVDEKDPLAAVRRNDRRWFTTSFADGHAKIIETSISPELFLKLLTADGGETIDAAY